MRIFVCSPYSGDIEANTRNAQRLCRIVTRLGHAPFAPHLMYPQFLSEHLTSDREAGIAAGMEWLREADEVWVDAADIDSCSRGMRAEVLAAKHCGIPVRWSPLVWKSDAKSGSDA